MKGGKKVINRFKFELSGRIVQTVCSTALTILLARLLEPSSYGLLMLALSVFAFVKLFSKLGIADSGARYVSEYKETNPKQVPHILASVFLINVITVVVTAVALFLSHRLLASFIGEPALVPFLLFGSLYIVFGTFVSFVRNILQGYEAIELSAGLFTLEKVARLAFAIGLVLLGFEAIGAFVGYILSSALVTIVGLLIIYIYYYNSNEKSGTIEPGLRRRIFEYSLPLTATKSADKIDKDLDTILVGFFLNPVAVAYYAISKQVVTFVDMPVKALGFTISPTFGSLKANQNIDEAAKLYEKALENTLLFYIPAVAGIALIAEPLLRLVFGPEYLGAVIVVQVMSLYALCHSITGITSKALDFMGRARDRAIAKVVTSIGNVLLNIVLIPTIGVVGAAVATVISYGSYTLISVYIINTEFSLRKSYLIKKMASILSITLVMSAVVMSLATYVTGWITLFAVIGLGGGIWFVLSIAVGVLEYKKFRRLLSST